MIIASTIENRPTLSPMVTETNEFSIKNSSRAFYILSTSLYSDPILAILRELGCNARDSHVEAGQTKPWRLHLPTMVNPMLEIEDYGVGLSHSQVMNMFTAFFESTKTGSNEFVGALGLGSKSPFSYTDNFTVTAIKNGERNVYSAYKTDAGVPAIARLHTEQTDAGNGVLIQIAVKQNDFIAFIERASRAYQFFDQKPTCNKSLASAKTKPWEPGGIATGYYHVIGYDSKAVVIMGGVGYPIDTARKEFAPYSKILSNAPVLVANIGDVEMTPSREGLTYNKQTVDWIVSNLEVIDQKLVEFAEKQMAAITDQWELAIAVQKLGNDQLFTTVSTALQQKYFPNGYPMLTITEGELKQHGLSISYFNCNHNTGKMKKTRYQGGQLHLSPAVGRYNHTDPRLNTLLIFDDAKTRVMDTANTRISYNQAAYIFKSTNKAMHQSGKRFLEKRLAALGFVLKLASNVITKAAAAKKVKTDYYKFLMKQTGGYYSSRKVLGSERISGSIPSTAKYWVQVENGKVSDPSEYEVPLKSSFTRYHAELFIEANADKVVGFPKSALKKADKGTMVNLYTHLETLIEKEMKFAATPEGLLSLVAQVYADSTYQTFPEFSEKQIKNLTDPVIVALIKHKKKGASDFVYASEVKRHTSITTQFNYKYKEVSEHVATYYSDLNLTNPTDKLVQLMNYAYMLGTTKNVV